MDKLKLIRKIIRRDNKFFSGHIDRPHISFDYQIYGVSKNFTYFNDSGIKLNVRVSNVKRKFSSGEYVNPRIYDIGDVRRLNNQIRFQIEKEWLSFFKGSFGLNDYVCEVGSIKHLNLKKYY